MRPGPQARPRLRPRPRPRPQTARVLFPRQVTRRGGSSRHRGPSKNRAGSDGSGSTSDSRSNALGSVRDMAAAIDQPSCAASDGLEARTTSQAAATGSAWDLFSSRQLIRDALETESSKVQEQTVDACLPLLAGRQEGQGAVNAQGVPHLFRDRHIKFLHKHLGPLPPQFMTADPSKPWILYWCLNALSLLGQDVAVYRSRVVETVRPMQNKSGGFAGGFGQTSHLATTYAVVLSLCLVGGPDAYQVIERRSMWKWLCSLKQADGGFQMAVGGEVDVRGAYCAAVIISLLNIPPVLSAQSPARAADHTHLLSGLGDWVRQCQTFEGGVSAKPGVEAHGAYAFCALGCLSILDSPHRSVAKYLDVARLVSWLSARQYAPEGGFSGRTNKLVDGCYSHWVGGCWPIIQASLDGPQEAAMPDDPPMQAHDNLFSRNALIRYILCCGQDLSKRGGMRDKPGKHSDAYHTCYVLAGLSSAQHKWSLMRPRVDAALMYGDVWAVSPWGPDEQIFGQEDRLCPMNPVYAIPHDRVQQCQEYFVSKTGF